MSDPFDQDTGASQWPNPEDTSFDLDKVLSGILSLRTEIPEDAFTASTLGTERAGHGVLINNDGLVVTIGYLIMEARTVWLVDAGGRAVSAHVVGIDQETGFGLVQALDALDVPPVEIGCSDDLKTGDPVILAGHGGRSSAVMARVVAKHEFAGYWEYLLEEGIFTTPPHPFWGGSALIAEDGTLRGVGSLFLQQVLRTGKPFDGNMVVPIDLLSPILEDMVQYGSARRPPRPWLGLLTMEADNKLVVTGLANGGPAEEADVRVGDLVLGIDGTPVSELAGMYRAIWAQGPPGARIPLTVLRSGTRMDITVRSANRTDFFKAPLLH